MPQKCGFQFVCSTSPFCWSVLCGQVREVGVFWGRFWRSGVWTGVPLLGHNSGLVGLSDHFYRIGVICLVYILQSSCVWDPAIS